MKAIPSYDQFIQAAIEPMRQQIEDHIFRGAESRDRITLETLAKGDWNLSVAFPRPSYNQSRADYKMAQERRYHAARITNKDLERMETVSYLDRHSINAPEFVVAKPQEELSALNRKTAKWLADQSVLSWVAKMTGKAAEKSGGKKIAGATYHGSTDPWNYSFLDITFEDGTVQKWKTKMIINVSPLGKLFNQFPSTLVK